MSRIVITGASSGIGHALSLLLAREGHEIWALGRNADALKNLGLASNSCGGM